MSENYLVKLAPYFKKLHHLPGRIRLRIDPSIRQKIPNLDLNIVKNSILSINGIESMKFNKITASVTIEYNKNILSPNVWEDLLSSNPTNVSLNHLNSIRGI